MLNSSFDYKVYTTQFERGISEQIIKSHCHIGLFSHTTYLFIYLFLSLLFWKSPQTITWPVGQLMYSFHVFVFIWQGMMACMFNKGENCIAAGRLFVEASIHDEFVHRVVGLVEQNHGVCIIALQECSGKNTHLATNVAQVQILPGIQQVGRGVNTLCGLSLFLM